MWDVGHVILAETLVLLFFEDITEKSCGTDNSRIVAWIVLRDDGALICIIPVVNPSDLSLSCGDTFLEVDPYFIERDELESFREHVVLVGTFEKIMYGFIGGDRNGFVVNNNDTVGYYIENILQLVTFGSKIVDRFWKSVSKEVEGLTELTDLTFVWFISSDIEVAFTVFHRDFIDLLQRKNHTAYKCISRNEHCSGSHKSR